MSGADPGARSSAIARSPLRSNPRPSTGAKGAAHEEIAAGEVDLRATTGQPIESADHRGGAIGRGDRHGDDVASADDLSCGERVPEREHRGLRTAALRQETQREGRQREREAERGEPAVAQRVEQAEAAHGATVPAAASGSRSVKRAPRCRATPTLTPPP